MCFSQLNVQWPKGARMWACIFEGANMCTKPLPWMQAWNETNNFCPWTWNPHTDRVWQAGLVTLGMEVSWGKAQGALPQEAHKMCKRAHLSATPCPWSTCRHMQSTCWEKAGECGKPGALEQKAWSSVRGIRAFSPWVLCLHLKLKGHCHPGTATLSFCPCISNGECDWQVHQMSSLKVHWTTKKLRAFSSCPTGLSHPVHEQMEWVRVSRQYFTLHYNLWILFGSSSLSCLTLPQFQFCTASEQEANVITALEVPAFPDHIKIFGRVMIAPQKIN